MPRVVGRSSWRAGSGREVLSESREWLRVPSNKLRLVRRLSLLAWNDLEVLPEGLELLGGPPRGL